MKQSIQLRLGQHLTMTPQLQQAIRLLQLSTLELNTEIQQALESNMMLELAEEGAEEDAGQDRYASGADSDAEAGNGAGTASSAAAPERGFEAARHEETTRATDIPEELPVDTAWEDIYDGSGAIPRAVGPAGEEMEFENQRGAAESLQDHLYWQLNLTPMTESDRAIATAVIDAISADGYLQASFEELKEALGSGAEVEPEEILAVVKRVQQFDPPGVGARDLRECLLLQLGQLPPAVPYLGEARRLVEGHLQLLAAHDYNQLLRRMRLSREELQKVVELIQSLNPRPGMHLAPEETEYVVPDVFVSRKSGAWLVELNPDAVPTLRINRRYAAMIRRADNSPDNTSLRAHLQEARWFIKSLQSRGETLLKVATAIVERQRAFLEHGEEAMKPLVLHDIAETLGMHESTISRVTTRKYMHAPRGIYELKYFFSSHVSTATGGEASSTAIRAVIRKLIDAESPQKPLSDSTIAQILSAQGINVARRTVAKYREAMNMPPSHERKRLA
ncbi:MAG: RNA polymerase factor sigma-54 [Chromatiales bacterium]